VRGSSQGTDDHNGCKLIRSSLDDDRKSVSVWDETLASFIDRLVSAQPTPGGGAVAALSACQSAALLKMVLEISAKDGIRIEVQLSSIETQLEVLRHCVEEDIAAFNSLLSARKKSAATEADSKHRKEEIASALKRCTSAPLTAARAALKLVPLAANLCDMIPARILSDLGVALLQLGSGLAGLQFNVDINLMGTEHDPTFAALRSEGEALALEIASAQKDLSCAIRRVAEKIKG
jgi:methenyltetrahydrofolate cyclohydrolase